MGIKNHHYDLIGFLNEVDWNMMGGGNNNRCLASAVRLIMHNKPKLVSDCVSVALPKNWTLVTPSG